MLRIDPPFELNDNIQTIRINDIYGNLVGKDVLISGWGETTMKKIPDQLQSVVVKINSHRDTALEYWGHGRVFNIVSSEGKGACYGDSGGTYNV